MKDVTHWVQSDRMEATAEHCVLQPRTTFEKRKKRGRERNSKSHHGVQRGVVDEGAGVEGAVG